MEGSFLAGILIGLGVIINTQMSNPIIGACLFSFGLLSVIALQVPLYTGKIGYINRKNTFTTLSYLLGNFIGICFIILCYIFANPEFYPALVAKAEIKFSKTFWEMFYNGVICGMLIHFAVKIKNNITTIFAVMIFILIGAEHCIADAPYLIANFNWINALKLLIVIIGNSIGAIIIERSLLQHEIRGHN